MERVVNETEKALAIQKAEAAGVVVVEVEKAVEPEVAPAEPEKVPEQPVIEEVKPAEQPAEKHRKMHRKEDGACILDAVESYWKDDAESYADGCIGHLLCWILHS